MKKKQTVTTEIILEKLPLAPNGYHYEVRKESQMWWSIWIINERTFDYKPEGVRCIYGFVKRNGECHPPLDHTKPHQREVLCHLDDLRNQHRYSMIVPKVTSLLHLL